MKVSLHEEDLKEINYCIDKKLKIPKDVKNKIFKIAFYSLFKYDRKTNSRFYKIFPFIR